MPWVEIFTVFVVSHALGDYLLQTDFQALNKKGGLDGDEESRRALVNHGLTYTAAFVPALLGVARRTSLTRALLAAALVTGPHMVIDDGRLLRAYMEKVKKVDGDVDPTLVQNVDQSAHLVCLWVAAWIAGE